MDAPEQMQITEVDADAQAALFASVSLDDVGSRTAKARSAYGAGDVEASKRVHDTLDVVAAKAEEKHGVRHLAPGPALEIHDICRAKSDWPKFLCASTY